MKVILFGLILVVAAVTSASGEDEPAVTETVSIRECRPYPTGTEGNDYQSGPLMWVDVTYEKHADDPDRWFVKTIKPTNPLTPCLQVDFEHSKKWAEEKGDTIVIRGVNGTAVENPLPPPTIPLPRLPDCYTSQDEKDADLRLLEKMRGEQASARATARDAGDQAALDQALSNIMILDYLIEQTGARPLCASRPAEFVMPKLPPCFGSEDERSAFRTQLDKLIDEQINAVQYATDGAAHDAAKRNVEDLSTLQRQAAMVPLCEPPPPTNTSAWFEDYLWGIWKRTNGGDSGTENRPLTPWKSFKTRPDKTEEYGFDDGTGVIRSPDGSVRETDPDGTVREFGSDGTAKSVSPPKRGFLNDLFGHISIGVGVGIGNNDSHHSAGQHQGGSQNQNQNPK
jgi:hypothetical protein